MPAWRTGKWNWTPRPSPRSSPRRPTAPATRSKPPRARLGNDIQDAGHPARPSSPLHYAITPPLPSLPFPLVRLALERVVPVGPLPPDQGHQRSAEVRRDKQRPPPLALADVDPLVPA